MTHLHVMRKFCGLGSFAEPAKLARMADFDDPDERLAETAADAIDQLANGLMAIGEALHSGGRTVALQPDGRRDIDIDYALGKISEARAIIDRVGDDLTAIAAIAGYPMAHLGSLVGLSETAVPVRLARTDRLRPYARGASTPRVGRAELGAAAWDFRRGDQPSTGGSG